MTRAFAFLFLLIATCLQAQNQGVSSLLSGNDGLSQGMVFDRLQSHGGYLWIATKDGQNRYNGFRLEIYSHDHFDPFSIFLSPKPRMALFG